MRRAPVRAWRPWRALAALGLCLVLVWALQSVPLQPEGDEQEASSADVPAQGPAAVGDSPPSAPLASVHTPSAHEAISQELPPKPRPGQTPPDDTGQCPGETQLPLNGACWVELPSMSAKVCAENGYAYHKGRCFAPALTPPDKPLPTSNPTDSR